MTERVDDDGAILRALAILVTESHHESTQDQLDHWRAAALAARLEYDRLCSSRAGDAEALRVAADRVDEVWRGWHLSALAAPHELAGAMSALRAALARSPEAGEAQGGDRFEGGRRAGIEEAADYAHKTLSRWLADKGLPWLMQAGPVEIGEQIRALTSSPVKGGGNKEGEKP
jgi:hypothetical protein